MFVVEVVCSRCSSIFTIGNTISGGLLENGKLLKMFKPALRFDSSLSTHF